MLTHNSQATTLTTFLSSRKVGLERLKVRHAYKFNVTKPAYQQQSCRTNLKLPKILYKFTYIYVHVANSKSVYLNQELISKSSNGEMTC